MNCLGDKTTHRWLSYWSVAQALEVLLGAEAAAQILLVAGAKPGAGLTTLTGAEATFCGRALTLSRHSRWVGCFLLNATL